MKPIIFVVCLAATFFFSTHAFAQNLDFTINGKLENVSPMPVKMYLYETISANILKKTIDSSAVVNSQYLFRGKLTANQAIGITIASVKSNSDLKNDNFLNAVLDKGELNLVSAGKINHFTASGSGATAQHQFEDMRGSMEESEAIKKLAADGNYKNNKELQREVQRRSAKMVDGIITRMYKYVRNNPNNRVSPYGNLLLMDMPLLKQTAKDTLIQVLPANIKASKLGAVIMNTIAINKIKLDSLTKDAEVKAEANLSKVAIGSKAQDFTQTSPDGKAIRLSSYKGKYVLIDFWASWCAPCRAESPNVVKAYEQYKNRNFTILGVSLDGKSTREAWIKAIDKDGLVWSQVSDLNGFENEAAVLYDVKAIPQNFLIDPNGIIVGKNLRGEALEKKLASLFN